MSVSSLRCRDSPDITFYNKRMPTAISYLLREMWKMFGIHTYTYIKLYGERNI